jgi:hypothetical protein
VGVFFRTALLDYTLYRRYFPVWALANYETRRRERLLNQVASESTALPGEKVGDPVVRWSVRRTLGKPDGPGR